jgi:hypothetical protein
VMLFEHGQRCWGGPDRSLRVSLVCGVTNELRSVAEPNKCEYVMTLSTPAACKLAPANAGDEHDEL